METIKIYTQKDCPYCALLREYLAGRGISFTDIDVYADPMHAQEMVKISGQLGVPVMDVDGKIVIGWDRRTVEEALKTV